MLFTDRLEAGRLLGRAVAERVHDPHAIVLGLSYGGLIVAGQVADALGVAADAFLAPPLRSHHPFTRLRRTPLAGCTVILVDDGAATGRTVRAALDEVAREQPSRVVLALPVAPAATCADLEPRVSELLCLHTPDQFLAVAACYGSYPRVTAPEALRSLRLLPAAEPPAAATGICTAVPLSEHARTACRRLAHGLQAVERALAEGRVDAAMSALRAWRREAAHHLGWEERCLLPLYARRCGCATAVPADHVARHHSLLEAAADLSSELSRPLAGRGPVGPHLLRSLRLKLEQHTRSELDGLCPVIDAAGPAPESGAGEAC